MDMTSTQTISQLEELLNGTEKAIAGYRKMLVIAVEHHMEYEMDRIPGNLAEMEQDADDIRCQMIEAGYTPA